jgi:hypothetical protein
VVTHYGKDGAGHGGYSATPGVAVAARPSTGTGVAESAARALDQVEKETAHTTSSYDDQYVDFIDVVTIQTNGRYVNVQQGIQPVQGKYKKPLEGASFYEVVGHPELADSYRRTRNWKLGLALGGGALFLGGLTYGVLGILDDGCSAGRLGAAVGGDGVCSRDYTQLIVGGGVALVGVLAGTVGLTLNPHPVDATGARQLADEFNRRLREGASLPARPPELQAGLFARPGGGGVALGGRF